MHKRVQPIAYRFNLLFNKNIYYIQPWMECNSSPRYELKLAYFRCFFTECIIASGSVINNVY